MKEKDLIKSATDAQMPDLEKIRENILNQAPQKQKPKILTLKPTKLLAVAAVLALSIIGTIAAVANQNGGFLFSPKPEKKVTETTAVKATTAPATQKPTTAKKKAHKKAVVRKTKKRDKTKEYLKRLTDRGFEVTWLYDLGKIDDYHIFYAGNDSFSGYNCDYIMGDYTFSASKVQSPYGLGLYACSKKKAYTLADAYKKSIFDDFSSVVDLVEEFEEKDLGIEVDIENPISEKFRDYFDGTDIITLAKPKCPNGYEIYFNITENTKSSDEEKEIDGYTFYLNEAQTPYDLGLFVTSNNRLYTLEEALDCGILNMDEVFKSVHSDNSIPYGFTLAENEKTQETEAETETTEAVTESETTEDK